MGNHSAIAWGLYSIGSSKKIIVVLNLKLTFTFKISKDAGYLFFLGQECCIKLKMNIYG